MYSIAAFNRPFVRRSDLATRAICGGDVEPDVSYDAVLLDTLAIAVYLSEASLRTRMALPGKWPKVLQRRWIVLCRIYGNFFLEALRCRGLTSSKTQKG